MTRKLLAVGATLILTTGLIIGSVSAGPGAQSRAPAKGNEVFRPMAQQSLPFTVAQSQLAKPNKVTLAPHHTIQSVRAGKVAPNLSDQLNTAGASQQFDVLVTTNTDPSELVALLGAQAVKQTFKSALYGFAAHLTADQLHNLESMGTVSTIDMDEVVQATDDGSETWTGVKKAKEDFHLSGDRDGWRRSYSERDVVIAIIDTGIDTTHKDLAGKVIGWHDMINAADTPYDDHGHGTHVSSIAAGAGIANPTLQGVAPGAALVGVKVLDGNGSGTFATVIGGIDWAVENKEKYNIRVLNMSLGTRSSSDGTDPLSQAVNGAVDAGIVVVVAAGNGGPGFYTTGTPAAADKVISVCAMRDVARVGWSVTPWSSRGPTLDNRTKPDICAPGSRITAALAGTTGRYVTYSGTSMASPFVAGVAALMFEVNPYLTVDNVKQALFSTAQDWGAPGKDNEYGWGRIDAYRALQHVLNLPGVGPAGPIHAAVSTTIADASEDWWYIIVTDTAKPIAITMLQTDSLESNYDLDLYLYDAKGNKLAASEGTDRQETVNYRALKPGVYFIQVMAYQGSGGYSLDGSWR